MREDPGPEERLRSVARARGLQEPERIARALLGWLEAVLEENRRVNLTAAATLPEAVEAIGASALAVGRTWARATPPELVVDVGTGNGLPGVVAALLWPESRVLLVERRGRKAEAVARCLARVGLPNAEVLKADGRELLAHEPDLAGRVDLVLVRAVGTLEELARMAAPWLARGGRIAHWKGEGLTPAQRRAGADAARAAGLEVLPELEFGDDGGPARIVIYARKR